MYKNQLDYDDAQEPEMTREEAIEEKQCQIADKIEIAIKSDSNASAIAFINYLAAEIDDDEDFEMLSAIVQDALNRPFEDRHKAIVKLVSNAIRSQALALAKQEYPGGQDENNS